MGDTQIKVGDVVAWEDVPSGAIVKDDEGDYALRIDHVGSWVGLCGKLHEWEPNWRWEGAFDGSVTIVAVGVGVPLSMNQLAAILA